MSKHLLLALALTPALASATTLQNIPRSNSWEPGGRGWGAGFTATGKTSFFADATPGTAGDTIKVEASVTGWSKMFDDKDEIIDLRGVGTRKIGGANDYDVGLYVWMFGTKVQLWGDSYAGGSYISMEDTISRTFASAEARFWYVLKVKATARGEVGYSAFGAFHDQSIGVTFKPAIRAVARGTFSVDAIVAEAGVYGELELIEASLPIYTQVITSTQCTGYRSNVDIKATVQGLSGELGVFLRLIGQSKDTELWSWPSQLSQTTHLYDGADVHYCL